MYLLKSLEKFSLRYQNNHSMHYNVKRGTKHNVNLHLQLCFILYLC